ncbi:mucin-2-like isoform X4 [Danio aesculapii]|uniref:mucin-2-like isoform X4 n=1 Tax=Danio aesculapii TaxID=1142201 RepID=UPI0024BFDCAF|nr:mucin-2-like isoform X4 [Danio aesculapii]
MLLKVTVTVNCTNYHVIVEGLGMAFEKMTSIRRQEIANVLVGHLKAAAAQFSTPGCRQNTESDAKWLDINLGQFSSLASYSDLKALNISVLAALESLSPDQKAELLLDRSTHALENVTVVQEVLTSILKSPDKNQLENFFQTFVEVSKEENITYIANVAVRETMLNLTLTALAPKLPLFETSDYALWFQINLVVLLASFNPSVLEVIPVNITCDSYQAMLKGMEAALADLPPQVGEQLKLSVDKLQKSPPEGCTPPTTPPSVSPTAVCEETLVDEKTLCAGVNSVQLQPSGSVSAPLCNFSLSEYACSSVASSLSSDNLNKLLTCKAATVMSNSTETWKLLFQKVAGVLENALSAYSSQNLSNGLPVSSVLDAIGEVTISNFSASELTNASFIAAWFQVRLTPFLPSVSVEFLSCLSTKNFSCDSYQAVVLALSHQASFMEAETKQDVFRAFIQPFLSRDDLTDAACLAKMTSSAEWLEKNFGQFSGYAAVEYLQRLNANFSSFESLSLLNPTQVAELTLSSGALNSTDKIGAVFDRLEKGNSFVNVEEFLMELNAASEILQISPTVSDVMMNRTFTIIEAKFEVFETHDWVVWFEENLFPILPSFSTQMLLKVTVTVNCTNYHVIVEGLGMAFEKMTSIRRQEIANVLVGHLKAAAAQFSTPGCRQNTESDAKWLDINLGQFSSLASYSDLKALNISVLAALESLSPDQKAELLLDRSTHALENVTVVQEVLTSILKSPEKNQLENFFQTFVEVSKEENITYIANVAVRETMLNLTLTALAPKLPLFETSDYALWFQINLVVLLASFNPSVLEVIPVNITCDSYQAMLKGMEAALADLPPQVGEQLKLSVDKLQKSPPEDCMTPLPTAPPTASPTLPPTASPTAFSTTSPTMPHISPPNTSHNPPPTMLPTAPPTANPTTSLTTPHTAPPTANPTASPSMPHISPPTKPHTAPPTANPTASLTTRHTAPPTANPSASPTTPYISPPTTPHTAPPPANLTTPLTTPHSAPPTANPTASLTTTHNASLTANPTTSVTTPHNAPPTANPTASLTTPHTALLTSSPTAPPTPPHTAPHTAPPTANPTTSPTTPHTSPPTTSQTSPPTMSQTAPPTANPTASFTTPHIAPPTANPSTSSTMPYISLPTTPQTSTPTTPHTALPTANPTAPLTTPHSAPPTAIPTASLSTPHTALPTANPTAPLTTPHSAPPTAIPTASLTTPHTALLTSSPTAAPTAPHTAPHTAPPTANPTTSPTTPYTSPPTTPQTSPPTTPHTAPPTANPTASLTTPHTAPPTANPTASLTMPYISLPTTPQTSTPTTPHTALPTANPTAPLTTPHSAPPTAFPTASLSTPHTALPTANPTAPLTTPHSAPPTAIPTASLTTPHTALLTSSPTAAPTAPHTAPHTAPPTANPTTSPPRPTHLRPPRPKLLPSPRPTLLPPQLTLPLLSPHPTLLPPQLTLLLPSPCPTFLCPPRPKLLPPPHPTLLPPQLTLPLPLPHPTVLPPQLSLPLPSPHPTMLSPQLTLPLPSPHPTLLSSPLPPQLPQQLPTPLPTLLSPQLTLPLPSPHPTLLLPQLTLPLPPPRPTHLRPPRPKLLPPPRPPLLPPQLTLLLPSPHPTLLPPQLTLLLPSPHPTLLLPQLTLLLLLPRPTLLPPPHPTVLPPQLTLPLPLPHPTLLPPPRPTPLFPPLPPQLPQQLSPPLPQHPTLPLSPQLPPPLPTPHPLLFTTPLLLLCPLTLFVKKH